MKVVEFAKKHEITVNQAKKAVKVVLGVDVSKDRTLTPDELSSLEAALLSYKWGEQQHKALPLGVVQPSQNGVQALGAITPETFAEQTVQPDIQTIQPDIQPDEHLNNNVQSVQPSAEETFSDKLEVENVQTDVQPRPQLDSNISSNDEVASIPTDSSKLDATPNILDSDSKLDADFVQPSPTENALPVSNPEDAVGRIQRLGTAEKDLREGTVQLKTEISKAQGRGAGVATGLAFMQGLLEGEQEVLDMFTNQSLEVFDQLQTTIDQQVADISQGTGDLLGKISSQRAKNQERLQSIRSRVANLIQKA